MKFPLLAGAEIVLILLIILFKGNLKIDWELMEFSR